MPNATPDAVHDAAATPTAPVCFVDLDGVLVDFVAGALAAHGKSLPAGAVGWNLEVQLGMDADAFWGKLDRAFWAGLPWTPEGKRLLWGVERAFGGARVALLTSPRHEAGCSEGKLVWVRRELPDYAGRVFLGNAKYLAAGPGKVLVDDHDANVSLFRSAGGRAVLVPRSWNRRKADTDGRGGFDVAAVLDEIREEERAARAALRGCTHDA